ncbi:MAG: HlyC/CorC family transporter [Elusimicrobia bacterium]|nr:HlyC/CorC family transporter [Elusimicrobiota bacterium]
MIQIIIKFIIFLFFMFMAAFFSAAETAITSLTSSNIRRIKERYNKLYRYFAYWEQYPDDVITTMIVWMNLSVVAIGVSTTSMGLDIINLYNLDKALWISIIPVIAIVVTLIFTNLIPKSFGRYKADKIATKTLPIVIKFTHITRYVNDFLVSISNDILKLFGRKTQEPKLMQPDEVEFLLSNENVSPLSKMSRSIINRIIEFRKTKITQVMISKSEILAVNIEQPREKLMSEIIDTQFSRIPVYRDSIDNIIGIVTAKDIAMAWRNGEVLAIEDLIRPVYYVPETAYVKQILTEFKKGKDHMAIVVDEFGSTIGLVTMEDLLEEIVGEVWDEYDEKDGNIKRLTDGKYLINGYESISDVNDELKLNIPENHFSTINGWVLEHFGYIPKRYEKFAWNNLEIEIESVEPKKVRRIILKIK